MMSRHRESDRLVPLNEAIRCVISAAKHLHAEPGSVWESEVIAFFKRKPCIEVKFVNGKPHTFVSLVEQEIDGLMKLSRDHHRKKRHGVLSMN